MKRINSAVSSLAVGLAVFLPVFAAAADDYEGADAVLKQISTAQPAGNGAGTSVISWLISMFLPTASPNPAGKGERTPYTQWLDDLKAYDEKSGGMSADKAASQWVDLVNRYMAIEITDSAPLSPALQAELAGLGGNTSEAPFLKAMPGPAAWPALAKVVDGRPASKAARDTVIDAAFKLLAHTLIADPAGQHAAINAILAVKDAPLSTSLQQIDIPALQDALAADSGDPSQVANAFKAKVERRKRLNTQSNFDYAPPFDVPDLVTLLGGENQAEPLVREAILVPGVELKIEGADTRRLAARLELEEVANLTYPHWELAQSLDSAALYEALDKKFGAGGETSDLFDTAQGYYFLHLIVDRQFDKAIALAESVPSESRVNLPVDEMERAGYMQQVHDFLAGLLTKHPELPLWDEYIELSAKTGQTAQMLDLIGTAAKRTDLSNAQRARIHRSFYLALLAADQIDQAVVELRKVIAAGLKDDDSPLEKEVALARIGQLTGRQDLLEEGITGAERHESTDNASELSDASPITSLAELLMQVGRGPEAEKVIAEAITRSSSTSDRSDYLAALMRLYYQAGRPDDVIAVLQKFPGWGVADLKDLLDTETDGFSIAEFSTHAAADTFPVGYMAAWALAQKGQKDLALKIDNALLDRDGSYDPGFELLAKISGQDAIPRLDLLARRDRFESRPLIWKAQLQLDAGNLDAAGASARAAITIDPSDGEQGPGRRMRAYDVLANILDRKGDKEHAQLYHGAVAAIRISEHSDRFYEAGMLTRAVKMYEDALTHFADAYCIQSRLALRLAELGDNAGAEEHYRRAYELMPQSFGRVESHCFGCERAFAGVVAQSIAEKVFTQLAAKMPDKPQVHYLLGYLRSEEGRYREALPEFQKAVQLDPDYLNAWKEIGETGEEMRLPTALRSEVAINEVRLDPLQRHAEVQAADVTDLAGLWNAVAAGSALAPPPQEPLLPLTASAAMLKNQNSDLADNSISSYNSYSPPPSPSETIGGNRFISAADQIFSALQMSGRP